MAAYEIYLQSYAKLAGGKGLEAADFCDDEGTTYAGQDMAAVALAASDVMAKAPARAKRDFEDGVSKMLS